MGANFRKVLCGAQGIVPGAFLKAPSTKKNINRLQKANKKATAETKIRRTNWSIETWQKNQFTPLSVCSIAANRVSEEADYTLTFNVVNPKENLTYGLRSSWFVFMMSNIGWVWSVRLIKKMKIFWWSLCILIFLQDPSNGQIEMMFAGSQILHIVCSTKTPSLSTVTARQYTFDTAELETIWNCIDKHMSHWAHSF